MKGIDAPLTLYQVVREAAAHSRFEVAVQRGLTPLVGREHEVGLLSERWERAQQAEGQVVLLSGEPGIGKSRLVEVMREQAEHDGALRLEFRCSPYHQNSAFYPIIDHLHRFLHFDQLASPAERLTTLEQRLAAYQFPQADTVPLLAALLSLPQPAHSPPLNVSPQRQKQKTQEVLVAWLIEEAERQALYCPWEDLHWADPSTLELLTLLIEQVPTTRLYLLLTFRPEFAPPWGTRSHISHLALSRLGRGQVTQMIERVAGERVLPSEMLQQIVAKTDGVPLFVEELTKMVVESAETPGQSLHQAIPATLQDSLMARLDRLGAAKEVAQLGATLGREFSYELLHAIAPIDEDALQNGLSQLLSAELIYQRGVPPHKQYIFKHALIQDAAYQSLLKSRRQQLHQQIAQVLENCFPDTKDTQPELLAHHYTEAGLIEQAISYWQQAGQQAVQRSANTEAINHLSTALDMLMTRPETHERTAQELALRLAIGPPLIAAQGFTTPEVEQHYTRARVLCGQLRNSPQRFPMLWGLWLFHLIRGELNTARELAEECLQFAEPTDEAGLLVPAHFAVGVTCLYRGEFVCAREALERSARHYQREHQALTLLYGNMNPQVASLGHMAWALWFLGYPKQARTRSQEALHLAQELSHPYSLAFILTGAAGLRVGLREGGLAQEHAEQIMTLSSENGFPDYAALGTIQRGGALIVQEQWAEGIKQVRQGLEAYAGTAWRSGYLAWLAEGYGGAGQVDDGLVTISEALHLVDNADERLYEAELYRLRGELTLQKLSAVSAQLSGSNTQPLTPSTQAEAEECFLKAFEVARKQQAKSLELRAATSLARLWQSQSKRREAHQMLSAIYNWFTEGFDTKDLQEAKAVLEEIRP